MRLALVYHQIVGSGGLERYLLGLARRLRDRGHSVVLVTAETDGSAEDLEVEIRRVSLAGVPRGLRQWQFARHAARVAAGVDLVVGFGRTYRHDLHRAGGGCHACYSKELPWFRRWTLQNRLELALERRLYTSGETRHFVVNAAPVGEQLGRVYEVPRERISVVHTPVDTEHFCPGPERPANARPALLFVSSNHRRKGLDGLLAALARVPNAVLWIAGARLAPRYERLVRRFNLGDRVEALGEVPDMAPVYRRADWFVHPTLYDACANTVLQSLASGLPGLVSARDGASEFIRDGENGFLLRDPTSPVAIAHALDRAFALGRAEREMMAAAARRTVLPLTWDAHVDQWEELFRRLATRPLG
jgi:UDP-glucose:(heptosyl)LPS alpha-1,3-glucosyltransferase